MIKPDLLAVMTSPDQLGALKAAEALAARWQAHLAVAYLAPQAEPIVGDPMVATAVYAEMVKLTQEAAESAMTELRKRLDDAVELRREDVLAGTIEGAAARHAMHADLCIMQTPDTPYGDGAFEGALFRSGRPVLLVPKNWAQKSIGKRVMVAWKAKREAARAVADAAPFLVDADQVVVVTVDAQPDGYGGGPGRDISTHMARKGLSVELRNIDGMGKPAETALMAEAKAIDADLVVMGGYGHSRMREFVFGGVTRALSRGATVPVLLSH